MLSVLSFLRRYMGRYTWWYLLGTAALLVTNGIAVTIPLYLAEGIDALAAGPEGRPTVAWSAAVVGVLGVVVIGIRTASRVLFFTPGRWVEAELKRDLFEAILRHQPSFLRRWETGDLFSRVSSDVNMLRLLAGFGVLQVANAAIALVMAGTQMVRLSGELAAILLVPIAISLVIVQLFIQRMFVLIRRLQEELAVLSSHVLASYRGVATVQGFTAEHAFTERFDVKNDTYLRTMLERSQIRAGLGPTLAFATDVNVFLLLFFGGPMAIEGTLTVGELIAFTTLVAYVSSPLRSSSFVYSIIKQAQAALERIDAILEEPADRPELPDAVTPPAVAPALEVRHLTFHYPGADGPALDDVSFTVPAGTTLGVLGLTGAGKTTLLRILARLYNPPRGTVFVDGTDILDLDLDVWRHRVTLVPQRAFLFSESVADNILLGRDDDGALIHVLDLASLTPDLQALPHGTDTLVGESGVRLSGGQRQRTALARGLVRDHTVLMLDDVLSAVDHATEQELIGTLQDTGGGGAVTTVIVAHRVSALQHADRVVVLDHGRVADVGAPGVLRDRPGLYRDTWLQQTAEAV